MLIEIDNVVAVCFKQHLFQISYQLNRYAACWHRLQALKLKYLTWLLSQETRLPTRAVLQNYVSFIFTRWTVKDEMHSSFSIAWRNTQVLVSASHYVTFLVCSSGGNDHQFWGLWKTSLLSDACYMLTQYILKLLWTWTRKLGFKSGSSMTVVFRTSSIPQLKELQIHLIILTNENSLLRRWGFHGG